MVYAIIAGSQGTIGPQYKLSIAAQDGTLAALATPLGSWRYPNSVPSLPFTSAQFSVSGAVAEWQNAVLHWRAACCTLWEACHAQRPMLL